MEKRKKYLSLLGDRCVCCGISKNLQFDHIDPTTKKFPIGKLMRFSEAVILTELSKCQLLCFDCHKNKTQIEAMGRSPWNKGNIKHGSSGYVKKCRCEICLQWNKDRNIKRRIANRTSAPEPP